MKIYDVLDLLPIIAERGPWDVNLLNRIRNSRGECPLCALYNEIYDAGVDNLKLDAARAGHRLGLAPNVIGQFIYAADTDVNSRAREVMLAILNPRSLA